MTSSTFTSLQREAALAADLIASGVESLADAGVHAPGRYYTALFGLSIGIERLGKLAVLMAHWIDVGKVAPAGKTVSSYSHHIERILARTRELAVSHRTGSKFTALPDSTLHRGIVKSLSSFARQARYSNLDSLAGDTSAAPDPIAEWARLVQAPALAAKYTATQRARDEADGAAFEASTRGRAVVMHTTEDRKDITSVSDLHTSAKRSARANREARVAVLQIVRFLTYLVIELADRCREKLSIDTPHMSEILGVFMADDAEFRRRKTYRLSGY